MTFHRDHLRGTRVESPDDLPVIPTFGAPEAELRDIELLYATFESSTEGSLDLLPPSLHPSIPPHVTVLIQTCRDSELGSFGLAQVRVGCRAGVSHRNFGLTAIVDDASAAAILTERWGFRCRPGTIELRGSYDRTVGRVTAGGRTLVEVEARRSPTPTEPAIVIVAPVLHWTRTPKGERLVQVSPKYGLTEANRGTAVLRAFDHDGWDARPVQPTHAVSAVTAAGSVLMRPVQYLVDPVELSEDSTEMLDSPVHA